MESLTLGALSGGLGNDEKSNAALRDFLASIERELPSIVETCIQRLVRDSKTATWADENLDVTGLQRTLSDWVHSLGVDPACHHRAIGLAGGHAATAAWGSLRDELIAMAVSWTEPIERRVAVIRALNRAIDVEVILAARECIDNGQPELTDNHRSLELSRVIVSLGHDLRSPLGAIESSAYLIAQRVVRLGIEDEGIARHVQKVREHVRICSRIVSELVDFARAGTPAAEHRTTGLQDDKMQMQEAGDNEVEP